MSSIQVVNTRGRSFSQGPLGATSPNGLSIRQALGVLPEDVYTVTWKVVSQADGHTTAGAFAFGVGVSALEAPPTATPDATQTPSTSPLEVGGDLTVTASRGSEEPIVLAARRLSQGHLVSRRDLDAGRWRFEMVAQ